PSFSAAGALSRSPLTKVPLRDPRSWTRTTSPLTVNRACSRLTNGSSSVTPQDGLRPSTVTPGDKSISCSKNRSRNRTLVHLHRREYHASAASLTQARVGFRRLPAVARQHPEHPKGHARVAAQPVNLQLPVFHDPAQSPHAGQDPWTTA